MTIMVSTTGILVAYLVSIFRYHEEVDCFCIFCVSVLCGCLWYCFIRWVFYNGRQVTCYFIHLSLYLIELIA